jgi:hypothetical protein
MVNAKESRALSHDEKDSLLALSRSSRTGKLKLHENSIKQTERQRRKRFLALHSDAKFGFMLNSPSSGTKRNGKHFEPESCGKSSPKIFLQNFNSFNEENLTMFL